MWLAAVRKGRATVVVYGGMGDWFDTVGLEQQFVKSYGQAKNVCESV